LKASQYLKRLPLLLPMAWEYSQSMRGRGSGSSDSSAIISGDEYM